MKTTLFTACSLSLSLSLSTFNSDDMPGSYEPSGLTFMIFQGSAKKSLPSFDIISTAQTVVCAGRPLGLPKNHDLKDIEFENALAQ